MTTYILSLVAWVALLIGSCSLVESLRNRRSLQRFRRPDRSHCSVMIEQAIARRESQAPVDPMVTARRELNAMPPRERAELRKLVEEVALASEGRILEKLRSESSDWSELTSVDVKTSEAGS